MNDSILGAVALLIPMVLSLTVHEYSHARAALLLGDRTAESQGRLTLNPIAHIDPIGTLMLPLIFFLTSGKFFGWAKPVPVNPVYFTRKISMKKGMLLVAAAGPASNIALALLGSILLYLTVVVLDIRTENVLQVFVVFIYLNVILAFFNLLPIPPLDGGRILAGVLPDSAQPHLAMLERYGFLILLVLLFTGAFSILFIPVGWVANFLISLSLT